MTERTADFVVLGSTPLARLIAGLLCGAHGRSVWFIGQSQAAYRLQRGYDLSVGPITRPETWALLRDSVPETLKLVGKIGGRAASSRIDPILFADGEREQEALSHIGQMAVAFGHAVEKVPPALLGERRQGIVLRDTVRLNRQVLEPALDDWMLQQGVTRLVAEHVAIGADGSAELTGGDGDRRVARQSILADDVSIMTHLPLRQWPTLLRRQDNASVLTAPTAHIAAPIMTQVDSGVTLMQQREGGISAFGPGNLAGFATRLRALLGVQRQLVQAGQTTYQTLRTLDGAPAFGRASGQGADVIIGLDAMGAFIAPALARWLAGEAGVAEADWFGARLVDRGPRPMVADYHPFSTGVPT